MKHLALLTIYSLLFSCGNENAVKEEPTSNSTFENQMKEGCASIFEALKIGDQDAFYINLLSTEMYFNEMGGTKKNLCVPKNKQNEVFSRYYNKLREITGGRMLTLTPTHLRHFTDEKKTEIDIIFKDDREHYYKFHGLGYLTHEGNIYYTLANDDFYEINLQEAIREVKELKEEIQRYLKKHPSLEASIELIKLE
jgi:hypothetical protein